MYRSDVFADEHFICEPAEEGWNDVSSSAHGVPVSKTLRTFNPTIYVMNYGEISRLEHIWLHVVERKFEGIEIVIVEYDPENTLQQQHFGDIHEFPSFYISDRCGVFRMPGDRTARMKFVTDFFT